MFRKKNVGLFLHIDAEGKNDLLDPTGDPVHIALVNGKTVAVG